MNDIVARIKNRVKINKSTGCWLWTGCKTRGGYGEIRINGRMTGTHRAMHEAYNGPIPSGFSVCHHCDNPLCANPAHLFLGTQSDNIHDAMSKGRMAGFLRYPDRRPRGESQGHSVLVESQVREIRCEYSFNKTGYKRLARKYGVSPTTIYDIVHTRTWKHVA